MYINFTLKLSPHHIFFKHPEGPVLYSPTHIYFLCYVYSKLYGKFMGTYCFCFWFAGYQDACDCSCFVCALLVAAADLQCAARHFPGDKWVNTEMKYTGSSKKMYTHFNERKLYVVC